MLAKTGVHFIERFVHHVGLPSVRLRDIFTSLYYTFLLGVKCEITAWL